MSKLQRPEGRASPWDLVTPIAIIIGMAVIAAVIVPAAIVRASVVKSVPPIRPVKPIVVDISRIITVVGIRVIVSWAVENGERNRESKSKANTGTRRRLREKRQSSYR
jgi:hypothetical protein